MKGKIQLRKAVVADVDTLQTLINTVAQQGLMLPRSKNELYENIRDFWCAQAGDTLIGSCALHVTWNDLAEIKSLAVHETWRGKGIGKDLVCACMGEAGGLGIKKVFALTYVPEFFIKLGFSKESKDNLPHKIWSECVKCVKFPDCNETAVTLTLYSCPGSV